MRENLDYTDIMYNIKHAQSLKTTLQNWIPKPPIFLSIWKQNLRILCFITVITKLMKYNFNNDSQRLGNRDYFTHKIFNHFV